MEFFHLPKPRRKQPKLLGKLPKLLGKLPKRLREVRIEGEKVGFRFKTPISSLGGSAERVGSGGPGQVITVGLQKFRSEVGCKSSCPLYTESDDGGIH